jgi:uncharacterized protein (TIGR02186 family)
VQFISKALFKATVRLPANIPVGQHRLRAVLYKNGQFVMEKVIPLRVVKTGLEQFIYNLCPCLFAGLRYCRGASRNADRMARQRDFPQGLIISV